MARCPHCGEQVDLQDLTARDNSFRDEPEQDQLVLDDPDLRSAAEPSDGDTVWDRVELDPDELEDLKDDHDPTDW